MPKESKADKGNRGDKDSDDQSFEKLLAAFMVTTIKIKFERSNYFLRSFVFFIELVLHERLTDPDRCKASMRSRKLILGHLKELNAPNIYLVNSLDSMLETSLNLYSIHKSLKETRDAIAG